MIPLFFSTWFIFHSNTLAINLDPEPYLLTINEVSELYPTPELMILTSTIFPFSTTGSRSAYLPSPKISIIVSFLYPFPLFKICTDTIDPFIITGFKIAWEVILLTPTKGLLWKFTMSGVP